MAPLKRETVTALVRDMIADGTLLPGAAAPAGMELARKTGYCALTCRAALRELLADGTLMRGASPNARLRVAVAPAGGGADRSAPGVPLSAALAARRHAARLTQPELATLLGMSVTTVGHAETGRLWQSREFWQHADSLLGGDLVRLYDAYQAARHADTPETADRTGPEEPAPALPVLPASVTITPDGVAVVWPDGTETLAQPPNRPG